MNNKDSQIRSFNDIFSLLTSNTPKQSSNSIKSQQSQNTYQNNNKWKK